MAEPLTIRLLTRVPGRPTAEFAISSRRRVAMGRAGVAFPARCRDRIALAREHREILDLGGGAR